MALAAASSRLMLRSLTPVMDVDSTGHASLPPIFSVPAISLYPAFLPVPCLPQYSDCHSPTQHQIAFSDPCPLSAADICCLAALSRFRWSLWISRSLSGFGYPSRQLPVASLMTLDHKHSRDHDRSSLDFLDPRLIHPHAVADNRDRFPEPRPRPTHCPGVFPRLSLSRIPTWCPAITILSSGSSPQVSD
jgi:hypothetical protein